MKEENGLLEHKTNDESVLTGQVTMSTYGRYFHSGGSYFSLALLVMGFIVAEALYCGSDYWLSIWTNSEQSRGKLNISSSNGMNESLIRHQWENQVDTYTGIYVYSMLISGVLFFSLVRAAHFFNICVTASVTLHNRMLHAVTRAPLLFFERNSVGM